MLRHCEMSLHLPANLRANANVSERIHDGIGAYWLENLAARIPIQDL
jgi:hypothetical protein